MLLWITFLLQGASITFQSAHIGEAQILANCDSIPEDLVAIGITAES
jgi:hypothetical protein